MKKLITLTLAVLLVCTFSSVALAAPEYTASVDGQNLIITITDSEASFGNQITFQLLAKDKKIDKESPYTDDKIISDFLYVNQGYIGEEGKWVINVNMEDNPSGSYGVRINGKEMQDIYFASATDKRIFLTQLKILANGANAETEVIKKLELSKEDSTAVKMFMLSDDCITKADEEYVAKALIAEIKSNPTCLASPESFAAAITHAAHIAALNDGILNAEDVKAEFSFNETAYDIYEKDLSAETKKAFVSDYFKGKGYITNKEIEDAFADAVLLAFVKTFDSYGDVKKFVEIYGEEYNVDVKTINKLNSKNETELYRYGSQLTVTDIDSFVKKVNAKAKDLLDSQKSSGGGGGIGSGSSGIGSGYTPVASEDTEEKTPAPIFGDMESYAWAAESVNKLHSAGIVSGVGEGKFEPQRNVTREEMITMLIKAYKVSLDGIAKDKFTDVPSDSWYAPFVCTAYEKGYVAGIGEGKFGAGNTITRQDAAVMAYNIAVANGKTFTPTKDMFSDDAKISDYAKIAVYALKGAGVINGMGDGSFAPKSTCTRAEAAVIIATLLNQ